MEVRAELRLLYYVRLVLTFSIRRKSLAQFAIYYLQELGISEIKIVVS